MSVMNKGERLGGIGSKKRVIGDEGSTNVIHHYIGGCDTDLGEDGGDGYDCGHQGGFRGRCAE